MVYNHPMKPVKYHCIDPDYCFGIADDAHRAGCSVRINISVTTPSENVVEVEGSEEAMKAFSDRRMSTETYDAMTDGV